MKAQYKELSDLAFKLQKQNKLDEALVIYNKLMKINPEDVNILNLVGMLYMEKKDYEQSINYLSKAVVLNSSSYILTNLGKAYYFSKQFDNAVELYSKALEIEENDDALYSLGLAYKALNQYDKALEFYNKAIKFNPNNYNAHYNLAILYKDLNNSLIAIDICLKAKEIVSNDVDLYTLLSRLYENVKDYENAIKSLEVAITLRPNVVSFYYNLGVLYSKINKIDEAVKNYLIVLTLNPNDIEALVNIAYLYKEKDKNTALKYAQMAYQIAKNEFNVVTLIAQLYRDLFDNENSLKVLNDYLQENNSYPEIYYQIALNKMDLGLYSDAMINYEMALSFDKENLSYLKGKAIAHKYLGEEDIAFEILKDVYVKDGRSNSTAVSLGMCYLKNRDFNNGMELYSKRSFDTKFVKLFNDRIWEKSIDVKDKRILVYSDCGLGDTIMFARYLPKLQECSASVILQTDKELVELLQENYPQIKVISKTQERPDYDIVMPIMDISLALNSDFSVIPNTESYLFADENKINKFKNLDIFNNQKLKVGICYQGNKRVLKNRSIPFEKIKKIFSFDDCVFYSFQLNDTNDEIISLTEYINDYSDTAALLKCIDVLVTIDSSIVHVAGALGVKTLLMLPKTSEWRWFDDVDKSSWYDSVQIFKQISSNNWDGVIENIKKEIANYERK